MTPEDQFERCYRAWTKGRASYGLCMKKWESVVKPLLGKPFKNEAGLEGILDVNYIHSMIVAWKEYHQKKQTNPKYIKRFETWLNQKGWLDAVPSLLDMQIQLPEDRFAKKREDKKASDKTYQESRAKLKDMGILK